jgi:hypothetical protein
MPIDTISPARRRQDAWRAAARSVYNRTGRLACRQGFVLTHPQARAVGLSSAEVRSMVRRKEWTAPRRGVLCVLPPPVERGRSSRTDAFRDRGDRRRAVSPGHRDQR